MSVYRVVADSSCLIGLAQIDQFELLKTLFSEIYIPAAVYDEVVLKGKGEIGSLETKNGINNGWIIIKAVNNVLAVDSLRKTLGRGESETILLCKELNLDCALIDERKARKIAESMNINTIGVIGIINLAIQSGFSLDKKSLFKQLIEFGFRIDEKLYKSMFSEE